MYLRIIDLSESPARLSVQTENLVIQRENQPSTMLPLNEVAAVILSHPQIMASHAALAGLASRGAMVVVSDQRHMPAAMLLPLETNVLQAERFLRQAQASLPTQKRLWKQIVRAKVREQGRLLDRLEAQDHGLLALCSSVRAGDAANIEAQASRRYWPALFGGNFKRERDAADQNRLLNYGYAVLRAIVARAICGAGLHPGLGLHHHNRYNPFCLADDLMEPFRPLVDASVVAWVKAHGADAPVDRAFKAALITPLMGRWISGGEARTLFDWMARLAVSLVGVYMNEARELAIPTLDAAPPLPPEAES